MIGEGAIRHRDIEVEQIEHRMFSFVSVNWRSRPLESPEVIINPIAARRTSTGLTLDAQLDGRTYERGLDVADDQLASVNMTRHAVHGAGTTSVVQS